MLHSVRRLRAVLVVGALAAASLVTIAAPAQAVAAPFTVQTQSATSSASPKTVTATCPTGSRLYGVSGFIVDGLGNVTLDDYTPNAGLTAATVTAYEVAAFAGNWSVGVFAICGSPTANLQRVALTSANNSTSPKSVTATCPAGTRLYGLGAELNGALGAVILDDLTPNAGLTAATLTAYERGAFAGNWSITGYAVCAAGAATMTRVANTVSSGSVSPSDASVSCPAGTKIHGVGGELNGALGNVLIEDMQVTAALVSSTSKAYETIATGANWSITAYNICSS